MATTWTTLGGNSRSSRAACTTGTEAAPSGAEDGSLLSGVGGFSVVVEADAAQTLSGAGTLLAYLYSDVTGRWSRAPDLDLYVSASAVRGQGFPGFAVSSSRGRVAYVPSGVTVSGGGVTIDILASDIGGGRA
jgi:hypothetical protein